MKKKKKKKNQKTKKRKKKNVKNTILGYGVPYKKISKNTIF